jgi:hypothetical protein
MSQIQHFGADSTLQLLIEKTTILSAKTNTPARYRMELIWSGDELMKKGIDGEKQFGCVACR